MLVRHLLIWYTPFSFKSLVFLGRFPLITKSKLNTGKMKNRPKKKKRQKARNNFGKEMEVLVGCRIIGREG